MQLQFNKTVIPCLHTVKRELQTQEQTQEVRLTDEMPDIGRVLACWGQPVIRGKEWRSGSAGVSAGVMAWILYAPEDGSEPQTLETWIPFQMKWDIPELPRDGTICAVPILRSVDARSLSARKMMVRVNLGVLGEMTVPQDAEIFDAGELPEDVQVLRNSYPICIPRESGEKAFAFDEILTLPSSVPAIRKLVRYCVVPEVLESRVVADKLVMRGMAVLKLLYIGIDGQLCDYDFELPFSQYAELDREYGDDAEAIIRFAVTSMELERNEEGKLQFKAGVTAQYVIWDRPLIRVVEDVYSPCRKLEMTRSQLQLPIMLNNRIETAQAEETVEMEISRASDVVFYPDQPQLRQNGEQTVADMTGLFQLLGYDSDSVLQSSVTRWDGNWQSDADGSARIELAVGNPGSPQASCNGNSVRIQADFPLYVQAFDTTGIPMVTEVEISQVEEVSSDRPSLMLQKAAGRSLWEIAKQNGSTVQGILQANGLTEEPMDDRMLLIPVL